MIWGWRGIVVPPSQPAAPPLPAAAFPAYEVKCWADGVFLNGEPSGESCNRISTSHLGLCDKHLLEITGHS